MLTSSVDSCTEIRSAPSVAVSPALALRVLRKVPESEARSVVLFIAVLVKSVAVCMEMNTD